jgi:uncharacterized membrane protein YkvA (DUF1232 family)
MRSPAVPGSAGKALGILFLTFLYFVCPIDLIPDVFVGFGQIDDLGIIVYGVTQAYSAWTGKPAQSHLH